MKYLIMLFLAFGCSTTESFTMKDNVITIQLACPETSVVLLDQLPWTYMDAYNLQTAKKRCAFHYPNSPCLTVFEVIGFQNYNATCGAKR